MWMAMNIAMEMATGKWLNKNYWQLGALFPSLNRLNFRTRPHLPNTGHHHICCRLRKLNEFKTRQLHGTSWARVTSIINWHPQKPVKPPTSGNLADTSRETGVERGRGKPPARRHDCCSPQACTMLGRASGYGCQEPLLLWLLIRSWKEDPAGSADADINININVINVLNLNFTSINNPLKENVI